MTEWLAQKATACVAHAPFYAERLRLACPGPIAVMPLAYDSRQRPSVTWPNRTIGCGY